MFSIFFPLFYLLLAFWLGFEFVNYFFAFFFKNRETKNFFGQSLKIGQALVLLPASFLTGTMLFTWITYLFAYFSRLTNPPLLYGNLFAFLSVLSVLVPLFIKKILSNKKKNSSGYPKEGRMMRPSLFSFLPEIFLLILVFVFAAFISFSSFYVKEGKMYLGLSVFSDFGPHLALIRSFSFGKNFPTEYPHFPNGQMRYHFFFQFLVGNLEFLGLRIDWAFNLVSILSLVSFLLLLYQFAVAITGKKVVGFLTIILFFFRSSFAAITFLTKTQPQTLQSVLSAILTGTTYIGETPNENWGLWTQNVYANQRHLPFGLGILIFLLFLFLPLFQKMFDSFKKEKNLKSIVSEFLSRGSWKPESLKRAIGAGIILGLSGYWNGMVVIATLLLLFFFTIFSKHRLEYLIVAILAGVLIYLQIIFLIGPNATPVTPKIFLGFLGRDYLVGGFKGWALYYLELLGILPILIFFAFLFAQSRLKILAIGFLSPFLFANIIQLTTDINVNHKLILISFFLINILIADFLVKILETPPSSGFFSILEKQIRFVCFGVLILSLTITGIIDLVTFYNLNRPERCLVFNLSDPLLIWVKNNTAPNDIFLTDLHSLHPILLAGRKIFYGWPYYAWSAGYDTETRKIITNLIYEGADSRLVKKLAKENGISYIVIEEGNRHFPEYVLNENLFIKNFQLIYKSLDPKIDIYKVD